MTSNTLRGAACVVTLVDQFSPALPTRDPSVSRGGQAPSRSSFAAPKSRIDRLTLFDLESCVGPPVGGCTPKTCAQLGFNCGPSGDGCDDGIVLDCGSCPTGCQTCGGGGAGVCGTSTCTPLTCATAGAQCGIIGNGCGATIDCGMCPTGQACGGSGVPNHCGAIIF